MASQDLTKNSNRSLGLKTLRHIELKRQAIVNELEELLIIGRYAKEHIAKVMLVIPDDYFECLDEAKELIESLITQSQMLEQLLDDERKSRYANHPVPNPPR